MSPPVLLSMKQQLNTFVIGMMKGVDMTVRKETERRLFSSYLYRVILHNKLLLTLYVNL